MIDDDQRQLVEATDYGLPEAGLSQTALEEGKPLKVSIATPAHSSSKRTYPVTAEQREAFIELVLRPHFTSLIGVAGELQAKCAKDLAPGLSKQDLDAAMRAISRIVDCELEVRSAKYDALEDYIRHAHSLEKPARGDELKGRGGIITHGIEEGWKRYWGNATGVAVRYWLSFDVYPRLEAAYNALKAARSELSRFLRTH